MRQISQKGIDLIKQLEGCKLTAYLDVAGVPTIGYGHTQTVSDDDVKHKRTISQEDADDFLRADLAYFVGKLDAYLPATLTQNQFDALVSFAYNIGFGSFRGSTLLRKLKSGDIAGAADQFLRWNRVSVRGVSVVIPGLTNRRRAERALFLSNEP